MIGGLLAIGSVVAGGWLVTSDNFHLRATGAEISTLEYTAESAIRELIALPADATPNLFTLHTLDMERALAALPAVASVDVRPVLPDRLVVDVAERQPIFILETPASMYLIDPDGVVLQALATDEWTSADWTIPRVFDDRDEFAPQLEIGGRLDDVNLQAILKLAAITPELIGSFAESLVVFADDVDGYALSGGTDSWSWRAVFGHYTPTLRPVDLIDRQVQCLRSLLASGEADIAVIYLSPLDERCGTFEPRRTPTPEPTATAAPTTPR